jgi:3-methyladenine DNA glycosylase AlkD
MPKSAVSKKITKPSKTKAPKANAVTSSLQIKRTAKEFTEELKTLQSDAELEKIQRYFKTEKGEYSEGDQFIGVRMGSLFELAKQYIEMPVSEIERLFESPIHEVRAGAVSIMDKAARNKKVTENRLQELFDLYIRRHDRINNWDLVDLGCLHMTGFYLFNKPRDILYKLAKSKNIWERRTAIVSTTYFIRNKDVEDTFKIAELLIKDKEDLVHKGTGWMLRFAGDVDRKRLLNFLDKYAAIIPRTLLRYSIEKLDKKEREYYMGLKKKS